MIIVFYVVMTLCYLLLSLSLSLFLSLSPPLHQRVCCAGCSGYYRHALVYVPGGASVLALIGLAILTTIIYWRSRQCKGQYYKVSQFFVGIVFYSLSFLQSKSR